MKRLTSTTSTTSTTVHCGNWNIHADRSADQSSEQDGQTEQNHERSSGSGHQQWRAVWGSVTGTAHVTRDLPCQDASLVTQIENMLVAICSDGAGSASHAQRGSALCCQQIPVWLNQRWQQKQLAPFTQNEAHELVDYLHQQLKQEATLLEVPLRELACTLSLLVLAPDWLWCVQVGDGVVIVRRHAEGPQGIIFWPEHGEYVNQTHFVTDVTPHNMHHIHSIHIDGNATQVVLLTDGLQTIALHLSTKVPHTPFFRPLLETLQCTTDRSELSEFAQGLNGFLQSDVVNERIDDDKTLILMVRELGS